MGTDYIYANGKKIARVVSGLNLLHLAGYRDQTNAACGVEGSLSSANVQGLTIAEGDQLVMDTQQTVATYGGLALMFNDGTGTGAATDVTTQQPLFFNGQNDGQWHHMVADLSQFAGETVTTAIAGIHNTADMGNFDLAVANVAVVHADASVTNINTVDSTVKNFNGNQCGGQQLTAVAALTPVSRASIQTYYYVDDTLGTAQIEFNGSGVPTWQGQFTPYGQEVINGTSFPFAGYVPDDGTTMPFKFTGKERDTESGLDYFGARYYGSNMGRFMSPDYSDGPDPVPFGDLESPQSLNLYSYVQNNPADGVDDDGHDCASEGAAQANGVATASLGCRIVNAFKRFFGGSDADKPDPGAPPPAPNSGPPGVPEGGPGTATGPLIQAQNDARSDPHFQPTPSTTFCNMASCYIGQHAGSNMGPLMTNGVPNLANTDANTLAHSGNYHRVGPAEAQRLANMGKVVYGVYKETGHGHIITVRPNNGPYTGSGSPSTGPNDPIINDIGRHIGVYPLSQQPSAGFRNGVIFYAPN